MVHLETKFKLNVKGIGDSSVVGIYRTNTIPIPEDMLLLVKANEKEHHTKFVPVGKFECNATKCFPVELKYIRINILSGICTVLASYESLIFKPFSSFDTISVLEFEQYFATC